MVAGGLAAGFPPLVYGDTALLSEALFSPCALGMAWLLLRARRARRALALVLAAGVLAGLGWLTRSAGVVLLVPLALGAWRVAPRGRRGPVWAAAALVAALVVVSPWIARDLAAFGRFVPVSTQGGWTLAGTYNAVADGPGRYRAATRLPPAVPALRPIVTAPLDEAEMDARLGAAARRYALDHPGYVLTVIGLNASRLWGSQRWLTRLSHAEMGVPPRYDGVLVAAGIAAALLGAVGAALLVIRRRGGPLWPWLVPVLLWLSTVVVSGAPRYRLALDPFVLMLAAVPLVAIAAAVRR